MLEVGDNKARHSTWVVGGKPYCDVGSGGLTQRHHAGDPQLVQDGD